MQAQEARTLTQEFYKEQTSISLGIILKTIEAACILGNYSATIPYISDENVIELKKLGYTLVERKLDGINGLVDVYDCYWGE